MRSKRREKEETLVSLFVVRAPLQKDKKCRPACLLKEHDRRVRRSTAERWATDTDTDTDTATATAARSRQRCRRPPRRKEVLGVDKVPWRMARGNRR